MSTSPMSDKDWETESDLRTLTEMDKLRRDPQRVARAKELAIRKAEEAARVAGTITVPANANDTIRHGYRRIG